MAAESEQTNWVIVLRINVSYDEIIDELINNQITAEYYRKNFIISCLVIDVARYKL